MTKSASLIGSLAALSLVGLSPGATAAAVSGPPLTSPLQTASEFSSCKWTRVAGRKLSISSFTCGAEQRNLRLVADDALPGFWLMQDGSERSLTIRVFTKAAKAPVTAILPAVRAASRGSQSGTCALVHTPVEGQTLKRYVFQPSGAAMKAWEAAQDKGDAVEQPCGPLGVGIVGDRYFEVMPRHPDVVIFVDMGSEIQIFDPATLRLASKP